MTDRKSLLSGAVTALGLSFMLAACAGAASPSGASPSGAVAGATAAGDSPAASLEPAASLAPAASLVPSASLSGQDTAEAAACDALQTWSDSMRALTDMDASTASVEDAQTQVDAIRAAWNDVVLRLQDVEAADEDAVIAAASSLESSLDDFNTEIPVADAIAEIQTAGEPLRGTYQDMADGLGCEIEQPY